MKPTIKVENLEFSYTKKPFITDVSFEVNSGEIFGFLGPSGAGKSTIQKILTGAIRNFKGNVFCNGENIKEIDNSFYEKIGIDFEFPSLYEKLSARKNMEFFSSLYSHKKRDINELLESVGLQNDANKPVSEFSKGMKSRLNFIKSLVHDPEVLFLDEPTSGLDPTNNRLLKDLIIKEKEKGKTIILTTHNMDDASELCDRVVFICDGKMKALDTPHNLIMKKSATAIEYTYFEQGIEKRGSCLINKSSEDETLNKLIKTNKIITIHSKEQDLGDVFMEITGRKLL